MKSNDLRNLIKSKLSEIDGVKEVYYKNARDDAMFPHVVYTLRSTDVGDLNRADYSVEIEVWDKSESAYQAEDIADAICEEFGAKNLPQSTILPTFYLDIRQEIEDPDKLIRHMRIVMTAQNYVR